jgi:hypothetical protein
MGEQRFCESKIATSQCKSCGLSAANVFGLLLTFPQRDLLRYLTTAYRISQYFSAAA